MRLRILAAATAAALATLALPAAPAHANHAWSNYHWARTANPFTIRLDSNITSAWTSYLAVASSDWTASTVLNTTIQTGSFGSRSSCTPTTGHVEVCNATYGQTGWLGVASISITTGNHISRGSVKLNDTYFAQAQYNTPAYRQLVTCQEVGHTFGLAHQDENFTNPNLGTCMDYTNSPGTNQHPNTHDYNQLVTIYSHVDSFNTPTLAGPVNAANYPAAWGKLVDGSATRGFGTFVREYGHGEYVVTHVLWVQR